MKNIFLLGVLCSWSLSIGAQTLDEAIQLTEREQFESAAAAYRKILAMDPAGGEAWFNLGENYFDNDKQDSAEFCYRKGIEVDPRFPLNHAGLAKILFANDDPTARSIADKAVMFVDDKNNKVSKPLRSKTHREVAEAMVAGTVRDLTAALAHVDKAIELDATDPANYIAKGDIQLERNSGDASEPLVNYKKAIEISQRPAKPITRKALLYYRARNYTAAIEEYGKAISQDPSFAPAYRGRAEAYFMSKEYDKATADYDKYLELNKGSISARVRYAQFLFLVQKYDQSLNEIATLQAAGVRNEVLKRIEAYCLCEKGDYVNALERMKEYFAMRPPEKVIANDHEYMARIYTGLSTAKTVLPADTAANLDSLAGDSYLKAARLEKDAKHRGELYNEATKAFSKGRCYIQAMDAIKEKQAVTGRSETNDWYYMGKAALSAKRYGLADSSWVEYINRQPDRYQGYLFRARTQAGMDSTQAKTWQARPYYEQVLTKMTPEERDKSKVDLEEALNYMGLYHFYSKEEQDLPRAKCYFTKVKELATGSSISKQVATLLMTKELKDLAPTDCDVH